MPPVRETGWLHSLLTTASRSSPAKERCGWQRLWVKSPTRSAAVSTSLMDSGSVHNQWCWFFTNYSMNIELYELLIHVFGLAIVLRLFHAGLYAILPLRGESYEYRGAYHCV